MDTSRDIGIPIKLTHWIYLENWKGYLETFEIKFKNWTDGEILKY